MIDDLSIRVRRLVRTVMEMPANSVRPAEQLAPAGGQTTEIATVKIIACDDAGWPAYSLEENADPTLVTEHLDVPKVFVASIQFFRRPAVNADATGGKTAVGIAKYSNAAFDRAARLAQRLQLSAGLELMTSLGLGLLEVGHPRNLSAIADATWESRGGVDVTFSAIARESADVNAILSAELDVTVQPDPTTTSTIEVTL